MMIQIHPLHDGLIPAAAEVEKRCLDTAWSEKQLRELPDTAVYFVALCGEAVCGIGSLYCSFGECELINLAVLPDFRRSGVAQVLMDALFDKARERHCETMFLEVAAGNLAAQSLYKKKGFETVGKRVGFYRGEDALVMRVNLC